jgi:hypothetical protein
MVATAAQIAANRANALLSTGPRTPEGKAASSRNALTHGAHASDDTILATAPDTYLDDFRTHFQPVGVLEAHLVDHLAVLASRRERLQRAMDALLELNERHALTEHLHERYGRNNPNAFIDGQPSWQAALRRYDGNTYIDDRYPEPASDPDLDPDPILCSLAYTLSGPRAAALFRHEASVDRRFSATLKQLTTIQHQRRAAAATEGTAQPATPAWGGTNTTLAARAATEWMNQAAAPLPEPARDRGTGPGPGEEKARTATPEPESGLLRALDRYLRATATPAEPWFDPLAAATAAPAHGTAAPAPAPIPGLPTTSVSSVLPPVSDSHASVPDQSQSAHPAPQSSHAASAFDVMSGDQSQSTRPAPPSGAQPEQNEPALASEQQAPRALAATDAPDVRGRLSGRGQCHDGVSLRHDHDLQVHSAAAHHRGVPTSPLTPDRGIEANAGEPRRSAGSTLAPTPPDRKFKPNPAAHLPDDEPTGFLSVLPRHPHEPSSIPAHRPDALPPAAQ